MAEAPNGTTTTTNPAAEPAASSAKLDGALDASEVTEDATENANANDDAMFAVAVVLPHDPHKLQLMVASHEQVHEIRQSIIELPQALEYSCFHLEHQGERINDFVPISDIKGLKAHPELHLVEDPYTEKEARVHLIRIRELIGAAGDRTDTIQGVLAGVSLFDDITAGNGEASPVQEYDFTAPPSFAALLPKESDPAPKTVKAIGLSPWNPPPAFLRQKGHLLYLLVTTNEGEQYQITAHVGGFFVNRSSNTKFDPLPKPAPKGHAAHSLLNLLDQISPSFKSSLTKLHEYNGRKDPLATFQVGNAIPAASWLVPSSSSPTCTHSPDITRTQETFLIAGVENTDTLRDWNEEFQSARELPMESVQDRIFRERLLSKLFADFNDAAARGAVLVARGEVAPLNPTEERDAQIFVYNNVFFSFGADGVGTFTTEGGDEAARVATGKDVLGVKLVNGLDIDGLYAPGTLVVDYLGKRIVGQSIVPGIFKQPEPGETQIHYGAVDGKDIVAADQKFAEVFETLSRSFKVKKHAVWDKEGKRFDLEASVEMKGLIGTDGRKYVLDLYRITPLDISWMEDRTPNDGPEYPHRMTVLRQELVENFGKHKLREWVNAEVAKRGELLKDTKAAESTAEGKTEDGTPAEGQEGSKVEVSPDAPAATEKDTQIDVSNFKFGLNPDVFSGQVPQTDAEKEQMAADEQEVRDACTHLHDVVIPVFLKELKASDIGFPLDGRSLSQVLHERGINVRYIGKLASLSEGSRLQCFRDLCIREMIARSFKHVAAKYLRYLPLPLTSACIAHLLNCLLGFGLNPKPAADIDDSLKSLYDHADLAFEKVTPESLRKDIETETLRRYRFTLEEDWHLKVGHLQVLREVCLKLGIQLQAKNYVLGPEAEQPSDVKDGSDKPASTNGHVNGDSKKKRKKARDGSPASSVASSSTSVPHTFTPDDIVNVVPIIKDSCPSSSLAEEALEAGRISIYQNQKKLGQELLLESLSVYEQIFGLLHPEVALVYHTLSEIYYQLDEKEAAVELARKCVIVAERTMGVDSSTTMMYYLQLSLVLHHLGDSKTALAYARHALDLWKVVHGLDHPNAITPINNGAVMLQNLKAYHESRRWFEESLRICEKNFGKQSVTSATLLFQLAQALALDQDSKAAVNRMRECYNIFLSELGPDHKNTKEAEAWLEQLTQNAVSIAKQAKDVQARRLRAGIRLPLRGGLGGLGTVTTPVAGGSSVTGTATDGKTRAIDSRSIDELIKFIEGNDKQKKTGGGGSKKQPGRGNPKRRGGGETVSTTA